MSELKKSPLGRNRLGKNQYAEAKGQGQRSSKVIGGKLPLELDEKVRELATRKGWTLTQITEKAFILLLEQEEKRGH